MLELSLECELIDIKNLWNIIISHKLNMISNRREFLKNISYIIRIIEEKSKSKLKSMISHFTEFCKNIYLVLKLYFTNDLNESNFNELIFLLQFPIFFSENTYTYLQVISQNFKNFPQIFYTLIDEFINHNNQLIKENLQECKNNIQNLFQNIRKFILYEMNNNARFIFDSNLFSIKNIRIKLELLSKVKYFF